MATTRIMPLHIGKGRTESRAISDIIDYVANPQKTDNGKLITGYGCDSRTADAEFLLAKRQYIAATGRVRGADDVIAYHVRQSFKPGEITPEDYATKNNEAQDKLEALVRAEASDMTRETIIRDAMMKDYSAEVATVQKAIRAAGLDMKANDGAIGGEFDRVVRMFAQEATARGLVDVPGNLAASKAALQEAQDYMLRRHGKATPAASPSQPAPQARKPAPPDRSQFPPTLANVPAAADATIVNEFAHLENLEGSALERALARLTTDQQERYLG